MISFLRNYRDRHQHPLNRVLHVIGLPLTFVVPLVLLHEGRTVAAVCCFAGGYLLQFVGHAIEGNDAGEAILVKKMLGMPYIDIVSRSNGSSPDD